MQQFLQKIKDSLLPNGVFIGSFIDGDFTVKRIKKEKDKFYLMPENKKYKPIELNEEEVCFQGRLLAVWRKV